MLGEKRMQKILDKVIRNIQVDTDILDSTGMIVASSTRSHIGQVDLSVRRFISEDSKATFINEGKTYMKFLTDKTVSYFITMEGTNRVVRNYCLLAASLLEVYLKTGTQKVDREEFLRRVLLDQVSDLEFQEWVKDFNMDVEASRCAFVIQTYGMDADSIFQILLKAFPKNKEDILILVDSRTVALIKVVMDEMDSDELLPLAAAIEETILNEASIKAHIGIGTLYSNIYEFRSSYLEALKAIEIGQIFDVTSRIYLYDKLLLERFLHETASPSCQQFYESIFHEEFKKILTDEMVLTIEKFFENSLNLSETARQLYIHRNTLVYRLDKIQKVLGLDLRNFHDAVTFKIMMMLERRMRECCD